MDLSPLYLALKAILGRFLMGRYQITYEAFNMQTLGNSQKPGTAVWTCGYLHHSCQWLLKIRRLPTFQSLRASMGNNLAHLAFHMC
jgi:hypothetical protein